MYGSIFLTQVKTMEIFSSDGPIKAYQAAKIYPLQL